MNPRWTWFLLSFDGRINRQPFWLWTLASGILITIAQMLDGEQAGGWSTLAVIVLFWPSLATTAKRLHDTDRSAWWMLLGFIPLGNIWLLVLLLLRGTTGPNRFGPDPLADEPPPV